VRFADSSFYFALLSKGDAHHVAAVTLARATPAATVTTEWVLAEVFDGLSAAAQRKFASVLLSSLRADRRVRILTFGDITFDDALRLYVQRPDQNWSLTDCASFIAMRRLGITEALTADHHFEQAGFRALLKP
jgi:predicted nucleic acid-binding protein